MTHNNKAHFIVTLRARMLKAQKEVYAFIVDIRIAVTAEVRNRLPFGLDDFFVAVSVIKWINSSRIW